LILPGSGKIGPVQLRPQLHAALQRLRAHLWPIAQASGAAALAWYITHDLLNHPSPFFAPIAAAISLGATVGRRWRNVVQMIFGVTLGIGVSEAVVQLAGTGALPLAVIVLATMSAAVLFSAMPMFVNQAAASAILVVTLRAGGVAGERFADALIGGGCALLVSALLFPPHPLPVLGRAIRRSLQGVATALRGAAEALATAKPRDPEWTLAVTHALHGQLAALAAARTTADDIVRVAPLRRHWRAEVERADKRAAHVALLANTALTLVRMAAAALEAREQAPRPLAESVTELAGAVDMLARGVSPVERARVRELARRIASERAPLYGPPELAATELQVRAAANDLLRVMRGEEEEAAWRRAMRVRAAVRTGATTERARRVAARSGAGALRRR
jgi:uncharacterized membrane protein YgaE (UPF0421/DUF939 family)